LQDMILGMHIVTGPDTSVWIERADRPVLADDAIAALGARAIRDDALFDDALIHLGGMGIVNGVAVALDDISLFHEARADCPLDADWAQRAAQGRFGEISDAIMAGYAPELVGRAPRFYEVTINPHDYRGASALHIFYFDAPPATSAAEHLAPAAPKASDAIAGYFQKFLDQPALATAYKSSLQRDARDDAEAAFWPPELPRVVYDYYRQLGQFSATWPVQLRAARDWSQLHSDTITGGEPGLLYNASYAINRTDLPQALDAITRAVAAHKLPPTFVFTVRFVTQPAGTLAFTRFTENAVIEIDGASPWYITAMVAKYPEHADIIRPLTNVVRDGAVLVREALEAAGVDFSMHWAKLGNHDAAKIEADFGPSRTASSRLARWRSTRAKLLSPRMQALFWNEALVRFGLVARPTRLPPK
jgi:FAD/FMN-containing dehydrogenase